MLPSYVIEAKRQQEGVMASGLQAASGNGSVSNGTHSANGSSSKSAGQVTPQTNGNLNGAGVGGKAVNTSSHSSMDSKADAAAGHQSTSLNISSTTTTTITKQTVPGNRPVYATPASSPEMATEADPKNVKREYAYPPYMHHPGGPPPYGYPPQHMMGYPPMSPYMQPYPQMMHPYGMQPPVAMARMASPQNSSKKEASSPKTSQASHAAATVSGSPVMASSAPSSSSGEASTTPTTATVVATSSPANSPTAAQTTLRVNVKEEPSSSSHQPLSPVHMAQAGPQGYRGYPPPGPHGSYPPPHGMPMHPGYGGPPPMMGGYPPYGMYPMYMPPYGGYPPMYPNANGPPAMAYSSPRHADKPAKRGRVKSHSVSSEGNDEDGNSRPKKKTQKAYTCETCSRVFHGMSALVRHTRTHTGDKPFKCTVCSRAFRQKGTLNTHMRRHTGEKPLSCKLCGERFRHGAARTKHVRLCEERHEHMQSTMGYGAVMMPHKMGTPMGMHMAPMGSPMAHTMSQPAYATPMVSPQGAALRAIAPQAVAQAVAPQTADDPQTTPSQQTTAAAHSPSPVTSAQPVDSPSVTASSTSQVVSQSLVGGAAPVPLKGSASHPDAQHPEAVSRNMESDSTPQVESRAMNAECTASS